MIYAVLLLLAYLTVSLIAVTVLMTFKRLELAAFALTGWNCRALLVLLFPGVFLLVLMTSYGIGEFLRDCRTEWAEGKFLED